MKAQKRTALFFLKHISFVVLFVQLISFAVILHKCFHIEKFGYVYFGLPFLVWAAGYLVFITLSEVPSFPFKAGYILLILLLMVCVVFSGLVIAGVIDIQAVLGDVVTGVSKVQAAFTRESKYHFKEVTYPLVAASALLSALFIVFDRTRLGIVNVALSLVILYLFWVFRSDKVLRSYLLFSFFVTVLYYGLSIYYRDAEEKKGCIICNGSHGDKSLINLDKNSILIMCLIISVVSVFPGFLLSDYFKSKSIMNMLNQKSDIFHIGVLGFTEKDSALGGSLKTDESIACYAFGPGPRYLRASVKEVYTGTMWQQLGKSRFIEEKTFLAARESLFSGNSLYSKEKIRIEPASFRNHIYLTPPYTFKIKGKQKSVHTKTFIFQSFNSGNITKPYEVEYFYPRNSKRLLEQIFLPSEDNKVWFSRYLQYPDAISGRTRQLAKEITRDLATPYEKIEAVKSYLEANYTYTLEVPDIPDTSEFVDHFLFMSKKGYCTYFASAATILLRLNGIPSRFVTGYAMTGERDDRGAFVVRNSSAHAWTEILVNPETDQWVVFDCAPLYDPSYVREFRYSNWRLDGRPDLSGLDGVEESIEELENRKQQFIIKIIIYVLLGFLAVSFVIALVIGIFVLRHRIRKRKVMSNRSAVPFYFYLKERLVSTGYGTDSSMCETDFLKQLPECQVKKSMEQLNGHYYDEFFGGEKKSFKADESIYRQVEDFIRGRENFFVYNYRKLLWKKLNIR